MVEPIHGASDVFERVQVIGGVFAMPECPTSSMMVGQELWMCVPQAGLIGFEQFAKALATHEFFRWPMIFEVVHHKELSNNSPYFRVAILVRGMACNLPSVYHNSPRTVISDGAHDPGYPVFLQSGA